MYKTIGLNYERTIIKYFIIFLIGFLAISCKKGSRQESGSSQNIVLEEKDSLAHWLDFTINSALTKNNKPSAAIGLIHDGEIIVSTGFGTLSRTSKEPVTSKSIFQIASVSKMFTGIIVAHLLETKKLNLNERITVYLNNVLSEETRAEFSEITLAHLMQHKAGIPNYGSSVYPKAKEEGKFYWEKGFSKEEFLKDLNQMKLEFESGSEQSYSNTGYNIVGLILEEVTGKNYDELLELYITKPLNMKNTGVRPTKDQENTIVTPYPPSSPMKPSKLSKWGYATPASGVFSTTEDLLKVMTKQLNAYVLYKNVKDLTPYILTDRPGLDNEMEFNYGLGFFERKGPNSEVIYQHDGDADGYTIFYTLLPSKKLGKVLITSSGGDWFLELDNKIEEKIFDWF